MRRFNNRIRRCGNVSRFTDNALTGLTSELYESNSSQKMRDVTFASDVSPSQRAFVLDHDEVYCGMCGASPGDIDDITGCSAKFHVELMANKTFGIKDDLSDLRTLCSTCDEGAKHITKEKPPAIRLLSQIRRAGQEEQRAVLDWLLKKFKK